MLGVLSKQSFKGLSILTLIFTLSACGGGGGGDEGKTVSPPSSSSSASLTANAGIDKTVNAGDRIELKSNVIVVGGTNSTYKLGNSNLEIEGTSSNAKDIVFASWTKTEGPAIALGSSGTTAAEAYFTAPSTGTAKSIKITYKLTLKTVDGTTAEDFVTFTVNRVNVLPTANAGPDTTADSRTIVSLKGAGTDLDGTIATYNWAQISGATVQITNSSAADASFSAPDVSSETNFEFTLTVTDNDGAKSTDTIAIHVVPSNAPRVEIHFPPSGGTYKESIISAFGTVTPKTGTIASLKISVGSTLVDAIVDSAGNWRANNIAIPTGVAEVSLEAIATDTNGGIGKALSKLNTSGRDISDYIGLGSFVGLAVDANKQLAYILTDGSKTGYTELFPVDLSTGKKGAIISSFLNSNQGVTVRTPITLTYSSEKHLIYVSSLSDGIISIDTTTGLRSLVSDDNKGTGTGFVLPYGLAAGKDNTLYVADNNGDSILAVDTETGNRTTIADYNSLIYGINAPLLLASDNTQGAERLFILANAQNNYILQINPLSKIFTSLITDSTVSSQGPALHTDAQGFAVDPTTNTLFVAEDFGGIFKVDISTGSREKLMESSAFSTKITYDLQHHLLYLLDGAPTNLFVADPISGQKIQISRGNR